LSRAGGWSYNLRIMAANAISIQDIEKRIDTILDRLPIFRLPMDVAVLNCLTAFESVFYRIGQLDDRFSHNAAIINAKASLQTIIPLVFSKCSKSVSPLEKKRALTFLSNAKQSLKFCERCAVLQHSFILFHRHWYQGSIDGRVLTFSYPEGTDFGRTELHLVLHDYHEERTLSQSVKSRLPLPTEISWATRQALRKVAQTKSDVVRSIPDEVYTPLRQLIEATMPRPTIDLGTRIGSYTVRDYYRFWIEFSTLAMAYREVCNERCRLEDPNRVLEDRVLSLAFDELVCLLTKRTEIAEDVVTSMLMDVTLDTATERPDILVQPLVRSTPTKVWIAPSLIFTSNWEVCLLRNWAKRYSGSYGGVVAQKKDKLSDTIGLLFTQSKFIVSIRRKLRDSQGRNAGDIDVAVFDVRDGTLVLLEVKWIIEPDSIQETLNTNQQISKGIEQIKRAWRQFESHPGSFLKQIFPNNKIEPSDVKDLRIAVIANGDVGSSLEVTKSDVPVLDYYVTYDCVNETPNSALSAILNRTAEKHAKLAAQIGHKAYVMQVKAGGFLFRLPGYRQQTAQDPPIEGRRAIHGRTFLCLCGSGLKYKDCCKPLEGFYDDVLH